MSRWPQKRSGNGESMHVSPTLYANPLMHSPCQKLQRNRKRPSKDFTHHTTRTSRNKQTKSNRKRQQTKTPDSDICFLFTQPLHDRRFATQFSTTKTWLAWPPPLSRFAQNTLSLLARSTTHLVAQRNKWGCLLLLLLLLMMMMIMMMLMKLLLFFVCCCCCDDDEFRLAALTRWPWS